MKTQKVKESGTVKDQLKRKTKKELVEITSDMHGRWRKSENVAAELMSELVDTRKFGDRTHKEKEQEAENHKVELETLKRVCDLNEAKSRGEIAGLRDAIRILKG